MVAGFAGGRGCAGLVQAVTAARTTSHFMVGSSDGAPEVDKAQAEGNEEAGTAPPDHRGQALLALALESPDDALRLVYADWLEEQGHPHARVIRAQLGSGTATFSNDKVDQPAPLSEWVDNPVFERGMLRRIYGRAGTYAQKATQAMLLPYVTVFGVGSTMLRGPCKKLGPSETLAWTGALWWWDCQLDDASITDFVASPHLARLSRLDLEKVRCGDAGMRALAKASVPRLRHLGLPNPVHLGFYTIAGVLAVLDAHPIDSLSLMGLNKLAIDQLAQSTSMAKLRRAAFDTKHFAAIAKSRAFTSLHELELETIDHVDDDDLAPLLDHPTLQTLKLRLWAPSSRKLTPPMVERFRARFGTGFTYRIN